MTRDIREINILGTEWTIECGNEDKYPNLNGKYAYCDESTRTIVLEDFSKYEVEKGNIEGFKKRLLRHEVIHAYLYESGLEDQTHMCEGWAANEEMVDWFAIQSPKIFRTYKQLGIL